LNRRACAFLALAYILDGILVAICCPSEPAQARYQSVWIVTDATLAAAFVGSAVLTATGKIKTAEALVARRVAAEAAEAEHVRERLAGG
jgi:hypothetical protein